MCAGICEKRFHIPETHEIHEGSRRLYHVAPVVFNEVLITHMFYSLRYVNKAAFAPALLYLEAIVTASNYFNISFICFNVVLMMYSVLQFLLSLFLFLPVILSRYKGAEWKFGEGPILLQCQHFGSGLSTWCLEKFRKTLGDLLPACESGNDAFKSAWCRCFSRNFDDLVKWKQTKVLQQECNNFHRYSLKPLLVISYA